MNLSDLKGAEVVFSRTQVSRLGFFILFLGLALSIYIGRLWPFFIGVLVILVFYLTRGTLEVSLLKKDGKRYVVTSIGLLKRKVLIFPKEAFFTTEIVAIPHIRYRKWAVSKGKFQGKPVAYIAGNSKEGILSAIRPDYAVLDCSRILIVVRDPAQLVKDIWG